MMSYMDILIIILLMNGTIIRDFTHRPGGFLIAVGIITRVGMLAIGIMIIIGIRFQDRITITIIMVTKVSIIRKDLQFKDR